MERLFADQPGHVTQQSFSHHAARVADLSDAELVDLLAAGNSHALEVVYDRYHRPVFSLALRMLGDREVAEELVQEVFLRIWRQAEKYSGRRGTLITWMLTITHNMAIDELRKRQRRPTLDTSPDQSLVLAQIRDNSPGIEEQSALQSLRETVRAAMADLPIAQRQAIELAYYGGLSQREIASTLDQPLGTVKTRMRLAMMKLRDVLAHLEEEAE